MYKITYETIDISGNPHIATGTVSYPRVDWPDIPDQAFPILSYQHGTVVEKSDVTSVSGEWILPAILTGSGYVYVEPDYLGLGDSEGMHPYQLKEPYGTAGVDMLRAVRYYAAFENEQFVVNDQLFLAGYSEGGYATMAMHQIIERDYNEEFSIAISFPMAGAYSMSGVMVDLMFSQTPYGEPYYFPYVLFAYLDSYPTIGTSEQFLLSEYVFLEGWFDGLHSSEDINDVMPSIPITIMKPEEIQSFEEDLNHPLRIALQENDLWNWIPMSPMHIFHGLGDELVPYENAQIAYDQFIINGAEDVTLEPIPESYGGHQDVAPWALFGAYQIAKEMQIINDLGDVNQDGSLDILDLVGIVNILLMDVDWSGFDYTFWASDVNMDANINILDIVSLINIILEI
jgi:pimeloyl-ACP methyl ester carboxylesterase